MKRILLAITGASGAIYGIRLLQALRASGLAEVHLILSEAAGLSRTKPACPQQRLRHSQIIPTDGMKFGSSRPAALIQWIAWSSRPAV